MSYLATFLVALFLALPVAPALADQLPQSPLNAAPEAAIVYPKITLFSTSWCPHCKHAKEYFTKKNIPFINRDVEVDTEAMQLLTGKYQSQAVPVIVIGDDEVILRGFNEKKFEDALDKVKKK
ncbi:glutaredoxin domain-containing protein [Geomesophilobacter sediminis]|uniref:NrdH-redoxin n=1 Tax=Geomesophilobacter sediminis TaxID=2798584 RepID=A0A8J7IRZ6_9BACT|nr:glutaredoxin domain-containing protein [Geomesophilobacter sediminis]MBJ6725914.1 NrdH-redoxin [Geomesophilobacter sediminis]